MHGLSVYIYKTKFLITRIRFYFGDLFIATMDYGSDRLCFSKRRVIGSTRLEQVAQCLKNNYRAPNIAKNRLLLVQRIFSFQGTKKLK